MVEFSFLHSISIFLSDNHELRYAVRIADSLSDRNEKEVMSDSTNSIPSAWQCRLAHCETYCFPRPTETSRWVSSRRFAQCSVLYPSYSTRLDSTPLDWTQLNSTLHYSTLSIRRSFIFIMRAQNSPPFSSPKRGSPGHLLSGFLRRGKGLPSNADPTTCWIM